MPGLFVQPVFLDESMTMDWTSMPSICVRQQCRVAMKNSIGLEKKKQQYDNAKFGTFA